MRQNSKPCASDVIEYEEYSMVKQILEEKGYAEASPSRINHLKEKFSIITQIGRMKNNQYKTVWFFKKGPAYTCFIQIVTSGPKNRKRDFINVFVFGHNTIADVDSFSRTPKSQLVFKVWVSKTEPLLYEKHFCPGCGALMRISKNVLVCTNIRRHDSEKVISKDPVKGEISFFNKKPFQTFKKRMRSSVIR